jgi:hypothetical protein
VVVELELESLLLLLDDDDEEEEFKEEVSSIGFNKSKTKGPKC